MENWAPFARNPDVLRLLNKNQERTEGSLFLSGAFWYCKSNPEKNNIKRNASTLNILKRVPTSEIMFNFTKCVVFIELLHRLPPEVSCYHETCFLQDSRRKSLSHPLHELRELALHP
jgi:hypothetical protein